MMVRDNASMNTDIKQDLHTTLVVRLMVSTFKVPWPSDNKIFNMWCYINRIYREIHHNKKRS